MWSAGSAEICSCLNLKPYEIIAGRTSAALHRFPTCRCRSRSSFGIVMVGGLLHQLRRRVASDTATEQSYCLRTGG